MNALCMPKTQERIGTSSRKGGGRASFWGIHMGRKGYKIHDVKNMKVIVSRNVNFFENIFPYTSPLDRVRVRRVMEFGVINGGDEVEMMFE